MPTMNTLIDRIFHSKREVLLTVIAHDIKDGQQILKVENDKDEQLEYPVSHETFASVDFGEERYFIVCTAWLSSREWLEI